MLRVDAKDNKNLIIFYLTDNSGCSHVRCRFFADMINATDCGLKAVILPIYTMDPAILAATRAIIWQKPSTSKHLSAIQRYKGFQSKYGFKMIYEIDDLFFLSPFRNQGLPEYNMSFVRRKASNVDQEVEENLWQIFPLFDTIMCSTDYLKKVLMHKYGLDNVVTVKNTVPRFLWSCDKKKPIEKDIEKPIVLYSGASGHYLNPIAARPPSPSEPNGFPGTTGDFGDWNNAFRDWIIKNVKEDKIDFKIMGDFPYFFKDIAARVQFIPWTNSYNYPRRCWSTRADFQIAPLVDNEFNRCKSALRFYESSIAGMGFLGSVFDDSIESPYEEIYPDCKIKNSATVEQLDEVFWKMCKKDEYNAMIEWQYDHLNKSGSILESSDAMNRIIAITDRSAETMETI